MNRTTPIAAALLALSCSQSATVVPGVGSPGAAPAPAVTWSDERALLLLMTDRRLFEPLVVRRALGGPADVRGRLALTLGGVGDARGLEPLLVLLADAEPGVRRDAAFALGLLGEPQARRPLLAAVADPDRETGIEAVGALARLGAPIEAVVAEVEGLGIDELWHRLLPFLHRFPPGGRVRLAMLALELEEHELRRAAAYALACEPQPESREALRRLLSEPDSRSRAWAAAALGSIGTRQDLGRLLSLLDDGEAAVITAALLAAERLIASGRAAASEDWKEPLRRLLDDHRPAVRLAAAGAASGWLLDPELGAVLAGWAASSDPDGRRRREVALLALARAGEHRAGELLAAAALAGEPSVRRHVARGAGWLGSRAVLDLLRHDRDPTVRAEVLLADLERLEGGAPGQSEAGALRRRIEQALDDGSPVVREAVLDWLASRPVAPVEVLLAGLDPTMPFAGARIATVLALLARAEAEPAERAAARSGLARLVLDRLHVVRRQAAAALEGLGETAPVVGAVGTGRSVAVYRQILQRTAEPRTVEIETARGRVVVELDCSGTPLSCLNFLHLANQGFYTGLAVERQGGRVVSGGPREDGRGGPGFYLRDEPSRVRFAEPGKLAMSRPVPDGAGSRFFLTLGAEPGLDGERVVLGRVTAGLEVLERLVDGDRVERISEVLR